MLYKQEESAQDVIAEKAFLLFFRKGRGYFEDVYFSYNPLFEKWRLYIIFTNLVNCLKSYVCCIVLVS